MEGCLHCPCILSYLSTLVPNESCNIDRFRETLVETVAFSGAADNVIKPLQDLRKTNEECKKLERFQSSLKRQEPCL